MKGSSKWDPGQRWLPRKAWKWSCAATTTLEMSACVNCRHAGDTVDTVTKKQECIGKLYHSHNGNQTASDKGTLEADRMRQADLEKQIETSMEAEKLAKARRREAHDREHEEQRAAEAAIRDETLADPDKPNKRAKQGSNGDDKDEEEPHQAPATGSGPTEATGMQSEQKLSDEKGSGESCSCYPCLPCCLLSASCSCCWHVSNTVLYVIAAAAVTSGCWRSGADTGCCCCRAVLEEVLE